MFVNTLIIYKYYKKGSLAFTYMNLELYGIILPILMKTGFALSKQFCKEKSSNIV